MNPLDLPGPAFLALYVTLICMAVVAGMIFPRWLREEGRATRVTDMGEIAYLAGGADRFAEAVVARLLSVKALTIIDRERFGTLDTTRAVTPAERSVVALQPPVAWQQVVRTLTEAAEPVRRRLVSAGLMLDRDEVWRLRLWQSAPYILVLFLGAAKCVVGSQRGHPIGFLILLMVFTLIIGAIRFFVVERRTHAGMAELANAQAEYERIRRAPAADEYGLAVALFGTSVLIASPLAQFYTMREHRSDGGGGGGGDSGDGGGCGGGGCGGCS